MSAASPSKTPGATAIDACDGEVQLDVTDESSILGATPAPGTYRLTYNASDSIGNNADPVIRTVVVRDQTGPEITLAGGSDTITVECGMMYTDPGATAFDVCDGIEVDTTLSDPSGINGTVLSSVGTFTLIYGAIDSAGNTSESVRTIIVEDTTPPAVELIGDATINLNCGNVYLDPGVMRSDNCTAQNDLVVMTDTSEVMIGVNGVYTVTITVTDDAGLTTTVTRSVVVSNCDTMEGEPEGMDMEGEPEGMDMEGEPEGDMEGEPEGMDMEGEPEGGMEGEPIDECLFLAENPIELILPSGTILVPAEQAAETRPIDLASVVRLNGNILCDDLDIEVSYSFAGQAPIRSRDVASNFLVSQDITGTGTTPFTVSATLLDGTGAVVDTAGPIDGAITINTLGGLIDSGLLDDPFAQLGDGDRGMRPPAPRAATARKASA